MEVLELGSKIVTSTITCPTCRSILSYNIYDVTVANNPRSPQAGKYFLTCPICHHAQCLPKEEVDELAINFNRGELPHLRR